MLRGSSSRGRTTDRRERGAVLIVVLWVLALAAILTAGLQATVRTELLVADEAGQRLVAEWLARAGVEQAIAELMTDSAGMDDTKDTWYDSPIVFEDITLEGGTFSVYRGAPPGGEATVLYGVRDESSRLNVNTATREQLMLLPDMTDDVAGAIIDWRDADDNVSPEGVEGGYYQELPFPYRIRNGQLQTIRELLLVKGIDRELLFGEDTNLNGYLDASEDDGQVSPPADNGDAELDRGWGAWLTVYSYEKNVDGYGQKRVDLNEGTDSQLTGLGLNKPQLDAVKEHRGKNKFQKITDLLDVALKSGGKAVDQATFRKMIDRISVSGEERLSGKINVNTAPREVLTLLADVDESSADGIISHRDSDAGPFGDIGDLLDISGIDMQRFKKIVDSVTVRSNVFTIRAVGYSDRGPRAVIEAVVDRGGDSPKVLYWHQSRG